MEKIDHLTKEQEDQLILFREEWRAIGLATGPANIAAVTPVINDFYNRLGKAAPCIIRCRSPYEANLVLNLLSNIPDDFSDTVARAFIQKVKGKLKEIAGAGAHRGLTFRTTTPPTAGVSSISFSGLDEFGQSIAGKVLDIVKPGIVIETFEKIHQIETDMLPTISRSQDALFQLETFNQNMTGLFTEIFKEVAAKVMEGEKLKFFGTSYWGSLDSYWIAYYLFPHLYLRPMHTEEQMKLLNEWATLAKNSFWWYPYESVCIVCDRPEEIHLDSQNRLHNLTGPAVKFSDGWCVYSVNGVRVPSSIIEHPETILAEDIMKQTNVEVRRVMMGIYGEERFIENIHADVIQANELGTLLRVSFNDDEPLVMVKVINSTPEPDGTRKPYFIRVPPQMTRVKEAIAWTFGMSEDEYAPLVES